MPAVAVGYRVPDPIGRLDDLLATLLLAQALSDGDAARLQRRLVQRDQLVTDIGAYVGEFGDPFDERDPTALTISAHYADAAALEDILRATDEEITRVADDGLERGELDRVRARLASMLLHDLDAVLSRSLEFAKFELLHGRAELIAELPERLADVTEDAVRKAAAELRPDRRAVLELVPGGAQ
jgi:predicted Zn-dependent peptidase